jgi:hypothetical protein
LKEVVDALLSEKGQILIAKDPILPMPEEAQPPTIVEYRKHHWQFPTRIADNRSTRLYMSNSHAHSTASSIVM